MSRHASIGIIASPSIFERLMAAIDGWLSASARVANRNGDLPYFGL